MPELPKRVFRKWPEDFTEPNFKKDTEIKKKGEIRPENLTLGKLNEMLEKGKISSEDIATIRRWQEMAGKEITLEEFRNNIRELLKKNEVKIEPGEK